MLNTQLSSQSYIYCHLDRHCYYCYSITKSCLTLCKPMSTALQASLSFTISWSLLKLIPLSRCWHPAMSSSVTPFCHQSFPAPESFPVSQLLASGGQYWSFSISLPNELGLISFRIGDCGGVILEPAGVFWWQSAWLSDSVSPQLNFSFLQFA